MGVSPRVRGASTWALLQPVMLVTAGAALMALAQLVFKPAFDPTCTGNLSNGLRRGSIVAHPSNGELRYSEHPMARLSMQMPFYIRCFRNAQYVFNSREGDCSILHTGPAAWLTPTDDFRQAKSVIMDSGRCLSYLEKASDYTPASNVYSLLGPKTIELRPGSTDHDVFLQVLCGADFDFMFRIAPFIATDRSITILDAGANVGLASLLFAQLIQGRGQVLAVDANPDTVKLLDRNVLSTGNVVKSVFAAVVNQTVADSTDSLTFSGASNQYWGYRVDHEDQDYNGKVTFQVKARSLKQLRDMTAAKHFDFIKLDIEGEEKHILTDPGSQAVLCEAICLFMELHERFEPGCEAAFAGFMEKGCENGRRFFKVAENVEYIVVCQEDYYRDPQLEPPAAPQASQ